MMVSVVKGMKFTLLMSVCRADRKCEVVMLLACTYDEPGESDKDGRMHTPMTNVKGAIMIMRLRNDTAVNDTGDDGIHKS